MDGQMSLFGDEDKLISKDSFHVIEGKIGDEFKVYCSQLQEVKYMDLEQLFEGFQTIRAITFSYDLAFINKLMHKFDYAEIILGADFLVEKDNRINDLVMEVLTNSYEAPLRISKYEHLVKMIKEGDVIFKTPRSVLDHRKIYILEADDGRTRVITASANMSTAAWSQRHMEYFSCDDSLLMFEQTMEDFDTMWADSEELPYSAITTKKTDEYIEGNVLLKGVKEVNKVVVIEDDFSEEKIEIVKYAIEHEGIKNTYKELFTGAISPKKGLIEITPKVIEKVEHNLKKMTQKRRITVEEKTEEYPKISFDYDNRIMFMNGKTVDFYPEEVTVRNDIDTLLSIFDNFNQFIGNVKGLKFSHYKMMVFLFAAPFIAKLRCTSFLIGKGTSSLPLFLLVASKGPNTGKTFMIKALMKMITGKNIEPANANNCNKEYIKGCRDVVKDTPYFIDEINNTLMARITDIIKNPEICESNQLEEFPVLVFATNDITEPSEILRKRMAFIKLDANLPSSIDQNAYRGIGMNLVKKLGQSFYLEYVKRMLDIVSEMINYMIYEKDIPDTWYPDLVKLSSQTILSILTEYGYEIPEYMRELSWNDDFFGANCIAENTLIEIHNEYLNNREAFRIDKLQVTIEMGTDNDSKKKLQSWANTLPPELKVRFRPGKDGTKLIMDRQELEKRLNLKMKKTIFLRRR